MSGVASQNMVSSTWRLVFSTCPILRYVLDQQIVEASNGMNRMCQTVPSYYQLLRHR